MMVSTDVLWLAAIGSFVLVAFGTAPAARAWQALGRSDREVTLRKVHVGDVPRVGGLVLMLGFGVVVVAGLAGNTPLSSTHELFSVTPITGVLVGTLVCAATGLYDDLVGLRARYKLSLQFFAAGVAVLYGVHWPALERLLPYAWHPLVPIFTIVFLVAAINALNLMDGLDGLAAGICALGLAVVLFSAVAQGAAEVTIGWLAATALGAVLGFLLHNRYPASVFMGDAGSYMLGFLLPAMLLFVEPVRWRIPVITLSIPLMVLAVPLLDLSLAVGRRFVRGQPIFSSDSDHIHHRLLARGWSHPRVVMVLWASAAMFACLGYLNVMGVGGWWTLLGSVIAMILASVLLGYHRILAQLPAFTGKRSMSWRDRRREVVLLVDRLDRLARAAPERDHARWQKLAPELTDVLQRIGIPAFEIRRGQTTVLARGDGRAAWAWLDLPLAEGNAEIRLALTVRLPDLQQEQLMLLERAIAVLAGTPPGSQRARTGDLSVPRAENTDPESPEVQDAASSSSSVIALSQATRRP